MLDHKQISAILKMMDGVSQIEWCVLKDRIDLLYDIAGRENTPDVSDEVVERFSCGAEHIIQLLKS